MGKNTSVALGDHFESFVGELVESGRYKSVSEAVRAGLRMLEEHEDRARALRLALAEGESSGPDQKLDMRAIVRSARAKSRSDA